MPALQFIALLGSSILAAVGQILLKIGSNAAAGTGVYINVHLISGLAFYGLGLLLWLYGLAHAPLLVVYPFTLLTFVIVGLLSVIILGEQFSLSIALGWAVVLAGVSIIFFASW
jgi:drug/metabolite transporter (DMT)-like permease